MKILLTGGRGILGTALKKIDPQIITPDMAELDITDFVQCQAAIKKYDPEMIIHAAAFTDVAGAEKNKDQCWRVNVAGTENMLKAATGRRFVYISTDYVFDGQKGNYLETDTPNPVNFYALTKLAGEIATAQYPNTLIIRTAFKPDGPWKYDKAFVDQFTSHDFVSNLAPKILQIAMRSDLLGVIHVAGQRKSMYDLAKQVSPEVGQMSIKDVAVIIPPDTSLNIDRMLQALKS